MKTLAMIIGTVACVTGCATSPAVEQETAIYVPDDLAGEWRLTMPAGYKAAVKLTSIGPQEVLIAANGNLSGRYAIEGETLSIVKPSDERFNSLQWRIKGPRELVLVSTPSAMSIGSDYTGATLIR